MPYGELDGLIVERLGDWSRRIVMEGSVGRKMKAALHPCNLPVFIQIHKGMLQIVEMLNIKIIKGERRQAGDEELARAFVPHLRYDRAEPFALQGIGYEKSVPARVFAAGRVPVDHQPEILRRRQKRMFSRLYIQHRMTAFIFRHWKENYFRQLIKMCKGVWKCSTYHLTSPENTT